MAYDIGPRIGIKGEKEFNDQIKKINNNIREYGSEMDMLSQKFSKNSKSQEALTAKTKVLEKGYGEQKKKSELLQTQYDKEVKKLKELASAVEKATKENGEGSAEAAKAENAFNKQAESVSKLKTAINTTEGYMAKLENEINDNTTALKEMEEGTRDAKTGLSNVSKAAQDAGSKLDSISGKAQTVGTGLTKGVTAPLAALGAGSVKAFNEVDAGMDIIIQKTGATGKSLQEMQDMLKNIARSTPAGFEDIGSAIGEVNTRFGLTGDLLEKTANKFIKFAKINNTDVSTAVDNTQKVMAAFNVRAEDAGELLDVMTDVGQKTGISIDTLSSSMVTNSASLQQMGFNAYSAARFLGSVEMSGADVSQVMSGLTRALANATAQGKPLDQALKEIQDSMVNAGSETEGLQAAYELFGKRAGGAIYQACKNGSISFEELSDSAEGSLGAVNNTFESTLDPVDKFTITLNSLKITGAEVGNSLVAVLAPALEKASSALKSMAEKWESLSPGMQNAIIKFGLFAAATGPLVVSVGKFAGAISNISKLVGPMAAKLAGLAGAEVAVGTAGAGSAAGTAAAGSAAGGASAGFGALSASLLPIAGIVAGIAAAIAAVILIIKNWGKIVEWLKEHIGPIIDAIKGFFTGLGDKIGEVKDKITGKFEDIKTAASEKFGSIKDTISTKIEQARQTTQQKLDAIRNAYNTSGGGIKGVAAGFMEGVRQVFQSKYDMINTLTGGRLDKVREAFTNKLGAARDKAEQILGKIRGFFDKLKLKLPSLKFPNIKLPHFSISGSFSLVPPKIPKIKVSWYKEGGILSGAQIFGAMGDTLLGGGEAGREAVLPLDSFYNNLRQTLAEVIASIMPDYSGAAVSPMVFHVYVGDEEFESYIVKTSQNGIMREIKNAAKARGGA